MGLHSTSSNFTEGDQTPLQGKELERRQDAVSPRAPGDHAPAPQDRGSQQKMVAADMALDWVLQEIVQHARLATGATGAFVGFVRANKIVCQAMSGSNAGEFVAYLNRDRRMVDSCLRTSAMQLCRDSEASEEHDASVCRYLGARSVVLVPILDETGEKLGLFGVLSPQADAFSDANLVALQSLSHRVADARAQLEQCTSVSASDAAAQLRPNPSKVLPIRTQVLRAMQRPLAGTVKASSLWILGILVFVLLAGWILNRAINLGAMQASAKVSAPVAEAPAVRPVPATVASQPDSSSSGSAPPLSNNAGISNNSNNARTKPRQSPAVAAAVKPAAKRPAAAPAIKEVPAGSSPHVPELEIENALDDGYRESSPPESVNPSKVSADTRVSAAARVPAETKVAAATSVPVATSVPAATSVAAPQPEMAVKNPVSTNAGSTSGSPIMVAEKTALEHVIERVEPNYPAIPNAEPVQGVVIVDVVVGAGGQVESVKPVDGDVRLLLTAAKAVRKWRFSPLMRNGQSVSFESHITFQIALP
jgi:periplasmic protein TonB